MAPYDDIAPFQSAATTSRDRYPAQSGRSAQSGVPGRCNSPAGLPYDHDDGTGASPGNPASDDWLVADQKAGPTRESRALAVQARTMEIYDQLGLAGQVLSGAYPALRMQIGTDPPPGGVSIADLQQGETRFPGIQIFEQSANEQLLSSALAAAGTGVLWRHRLVDLTDDAGQAHAGVVALLDGPAGLVRVRARWCIGADGARSAVRRELDIPFEGVTDDATFWVADLRGVRGLPDNSMAARFGDATFAVAFRQPVGGGRTWNYR